METRESFSTVEKTEIQEQDTSRNKRGGGSKVTIEENEGKEQNKDKLMDVSERSRI